MIRRFLNYAIPTVEHTVLMGTRKYRELRWCIQTSHDNAHNMQDACSSRVSRYGVLRWCLVSECAEWRGWMGKRLIVARVVVCVLHQSSAIF